jgi:hypothetical protein
MMMQTLLCKFPAVVPALMDARREMLSTVLARAGGALPSLKDMLVERGRPWTELLTAPCQFHAGGSAPGQAIEIAGMKKTPNQTRGYLEFFLAHAFPVVTAYRTGLHAGTVANSWESMWDQNFNYGHRIARYHKGTEDEGRIRDDAIIGCVVGVEYPKTPDGGWKLGPIEEAPGMRCVAALFKQAQRVDRILGEHMSGKHKWTVSMEVDYWLENSGVALLARGDSVTGQRASLPKSEAELVDANTPDDFKAKGVGYLPLLQAPDDLIKCFSAKEGMWTKPWCEHDLVTLLGGLNGQVHFKGAGSVQYGAEPTATIGQVLAGDLNAECRVQSAEFAEQCERFEKALNRFSETIRP